MDTGLRQRLANQLATGQVILFTGAGFSMSALNDGGANIPGVSQLRYLLWPLAFGSAPIDDTSTLADIYEVAAAQAGGKVRALLQKVLHVNATTLPEIYRIWFSMPWLRHYTLNIDDLDEAVQIGGPLPRSITSVSGLNDSLQVEDSTLQTVHLNGKLSDFPHITFSQRQYAIRTGRQEPWYAHLAADLMSHPVVFVGTTLDEPLLWEHIELRKTKNRQSRELRPGSYLVTPTLSTARRAMLERFNIQLVESTQADFATTVLATMDVEKQRGLSELSRRRTTNVERPVVLRLSDVQTADDDGTGDFLLGRSPRWSDIASEVAVKREFEIELRSEVVGNDSRLLFLTGTAGSGKSTTLMRLALELHGSGRTVAWISTQVGLSKYQLRRELSEIRPDVLLVDDADLLGSSTASFIGSLLDSYDDLIVVAAMRSTRYDSLDLDSLVAAHEARNFVVPHLGDSDINLLLDALTAANRLGSLKGMTRSGQVDVFERLAGRHLLVAMIEATSNERFEEKIDSECKELGVDLGLIYATVAVATHLRQYVSREELLIALTDANNESLNQIKRLQTQKLLVEFPDNQIRLRHRVVADRAVEYYRSQGLLAAPISGLLWAISVGLRESTPVASRERQFATRLLNHDFLKRLVNDSTAIREIYAQVEDVLSWDYHYYLQRGSFEVEGGDIELARNFLNQARSLAPDDHKVRTAWAYMMLKRASLNALSVEAPEQAREAFQELEDAIEQRGKNDSYPYHVIGSQGLSWVRSASLGVDEKGILLEKLCGIVKEGVKCHPRHPELKKLLEDIEKEYLMTAVPNNSVTSDSESVE